MLPRVKQANARYLHSPNKLKFHSNDKRNSSCTTSEMPNPQLEAQRLLSIKATAIVREERMNSYSYVRQNYHNELAQIRKHMNLNAHLISHSIRMQNFNFHSRPPSKNLSMIELDVLNQSPNKHQINKTPYKRYVTTKRDPESNPWTENTEQSNGFNKYNIQEYVKLQTQMLFS